MNLYDQHVARLASLQNKFWFNPAEVSQGTPEWLAMKLGVLSASNADKIVAKRDSAGRATYMASLISQICSCVIPDEMNFKAMEHGKLYEPVARDALGVALGFVEIKELPFMFMDDSLRVGVSPDGIFDRSIVEIKCPFNGENFIKFAAFDDNKKEWRWQSQFHIFAGHADQHIFCQYDPRMVLCNNLHYTVTDKSESDQQTLADAVPQFIADMDHALAKLGVKFGDHWRHMRGDAPVQAIEESPDFD
jgi:hypothetical protein